MDESIYKNNKNGAKYKILSIIPDCSEGREDKKIVVYMNIVSERIYGREKEEFYCKFTKVEV